LVLQLESAQQRNGAVSLLVPQAWRAPRSPGRGCSRTKGSLNHKDTKARTFIFLAKTQSSQRSECLVADLFASLRLGESLYSSCLRVFVVQSSGSNSIPAE